MVSVGQRLHDVRIKKGISLDEISRITKIRVEFLSAIEKGDYKKLPSSAYALGFVRNYAEFLGLPKRETLALFRREFDENMDFKVLPKGLTASSDFPLTRIRIGQTAILIFFLFVALLGYLAFQYRFALFNPFLEVSTPKEADIVSLKHVVVSGKTDQNNTVYINGDSVIVKNDGSFSKQLSLFSGKSTIQIKSVNRFGKETTLDRHVEVK